MSRASNASSNPSTVVLDEARLLKVLLREAIQKPHSQVGATGIIYGTLFDANDYALAWTLKRDTFLHAANLLGIKPQILGQIPWVSDIFDEKATLKRHLLAQIRSEAQKIKLAKFDATILSFTSLSSYLDIVKKWNNLKPTSPLLYPPSSWISANNPPVANRFAVATPWPNGTPAGADPVDFDSSDAETYSALDDANFEYAVNKYGIPPELISVRGKIYDLALSMSKTAVKTWTAISTTSTDTAIEDASHQLSVHSKAVQTTSRDRTEHSANKSADVALLAHAASLFSVRLGPLIQPFISSLVEKKQYAEAFALLDTKFLDLTHCHKVATILRNALGIPSTYAHCSNVEDVLNTFYVLVSRLETLILSYESTPAASRPSLSQLEENCTLSEGDWTTKFPLFKRKVSALETRAFLLDAFRDGSYDAKVRELSTGKGLKWSMQEIVTEFLSLQAYDNKHPQKLSGRIRMHSAAFGEEEEIDALYRQIVSDSYFPSQTFNQAMLPPSSHPYSSSWPPHSLDQFSHSSHDEDRSITAQAARVQQKRCIICLNSSDQKRKDSNHTHNTENCYFLKALSSMDDRAIIAASYRPAVELGLPPYPTLYQRQLANQSPYGPGAGPSKGRSSDNESVATKAELQQLRDELRSLARGPSLPLAPPLYDRFNAATSGDNVSVITGATGIPPPRNQQQP